jgi:hypothetical protein
MHQTMLYWQAAHQLPGQPSYVQGFTRIWETADKIVFSTRLASAYGEVTARAHLQPGMIRQLKQAVDRDMTVGGRTWPHRPSRPLVDELQLFLVPATVGGGKPTLWVPEIVSSTSELGIAALGWSRGTAARG